MPRLHITPVVLNLLIINALVFLTLNLAPQIGDYFSLAKPNYFGLHEEYTQDGKTHHLVYEDGEPRLGPETGKFMPVQIVSSFFSHFGFLHFFLNMMVLFNFGPTLEMVMGAKRFLIAYLAIGILSGLLIAFLDPSPYPVVGASGALFGIMVLYAFYYPKTRLGLMFLPIQFPIRGFLIGAAALSAVLVAVEAITHNMMGGISHFGHLSGMVVGFVYLHLGKLRKVVKK
jgi:membrane associated rhomboid family serine protease